MTPSADGLTRVPDLTRPLLAASGPPRDHPATPAPAPAPAPAAAAGVGAPWPVTLAIDTVGAAISLALVGGATAPGGAAIHRHHQALTHGHGGRLIPAILALCQDAGQPLEAVEQVAVSTGPGSFTGLRVALAAAQGLGLALGCAVLGIDGFAAHAAGIAAQPGSTLLVAIDSRRHEPFVALFQAETDRTGGQWLRVRSGKAVAPAGLDAWVAARLDRHRPLTVVGDIAAAVALELGGRTGPVTVVDQPVPDPAHLALLAIWAQAQGLALPAVPLYLRGPDARPAPPSPMLQG